MPCRHRSSSESEAVKCSARRQDRFWKPSYFDALAVVKGKAEAEGVTLVEAALRWLYHHSALRSDDGVRAPRDTCALVPIKHNKSDPLLTTLSVVKKRHSIDSRRYFMAGKRVS